SIVVGEKVSRWCSGADAIRIAISRILGFHQQVILVSLRLDLPIGVIGILQCKGQYGCISLWITLTALDELTQCNAGGGVVIRHVDGRVARPYRYLLGDALIVESLIRPFVSRSATGVDGDGEGIASRCRHVANRD